MAVETVRFAMATRGASDARDLTAEAAAAVGRSRLRSGGVPVFVPGSTAGVTTREFEPGPVADLRQVPERLAPRVPTTSMTARMTTATPTSGPR